MAEKFPIIQLEGSPREIGLEHGKQLADRIGKTIEVYKRVFAKTDEKIFKAAEHFKTKITEFSKDYAEEIDAIAEGAQVDQRWIYALNARSELISMTYPECTALYFRKSRIIGQNWDWIQALEDLVVIMKINNNILMMTEPGIIGKIGLNSSGLGVCFNYLTANRRLNGVPIHILLRSLLDSNSFEEAKENISRAGLGRAGNVLVGDFKGNYLDIEFHGDEVFDLGNDKDIMFHTNHYIGKDISKGPLYVNSLARYERAGELAQKLNGDDSGKLKKILLDKAREDLPICRSFVRMPALGLVGTVCSIVMDLNNKEMEITKGSPIGNKFVKIKL